MLFAFGTLLVSACALLVSSCALFRGAVRPASYGAELLSCEAEAPAGPSGWATYTPCCVGVNARYPLPDGGARDASQCYPPDGGAHD